MKAIEYKAEVIDITMTLDELEDLVMRKKTELICENSLKHFKIHIIKNPKNKTTEKKVKNGK